MSWKNALAVVPVICLIALYLSTQGISIYLISISFIVLFLGGLPDSQLKTTTIPNQGIRDSANNVIFITSISVIFLIVGLTVLQGITPIPNILGEILGTVGISGLVLATIKGGMTCLQHFVLRAIVTHRDYAPWNYANFLDYATRINLLQKIAGGYIFIHRLLQEHFINLAVEKQLQSFSVNPEQPKTYLQRGNLYFSIQ